MALLTNTTTTASALIIPEVWGDVVSAQLPLEITFRPFAVVDTTLQGVPGDTVHYSQWNYMGDAQVLAEGADVTLRELATTDASYLVKKAANGFGLTDEAATRAKGAPTQEGTSQLAGSFGQLINRELYTLATTAVGVRVADDGAATPVPVPFTVDNLRTNLSKFGAVNPSKFAAVIVSPEAYGDLLNDPRFVSAADAGQASTAVTGILGRVYGIPVVQAELAAGGALLLQPGALGIGIKRDVIVETSRDSVNFSTVITASMHYGVYLPKPSGVMKFAADA